MKQTESDYTVSRSRTLGHIPKKWSYNEKTKKLYVLFEENGRSYLIIEKALLSANLGRITFGTLLDGREFTLWNKRRIPLATT